MRAAYFEAVGGAAGDMIVGSLLDAGLDLDRLRAHLDQLDLRGYQLRAERVSKQGIAATQFHVDLHQEDRHHHGHGSLEGSLTFNDVDGLIARSGLDARVATRVRAILASLARAEAKTRNLCLDRIRFSTPNMIDTIVDIVGAAVALEEMALDAVFCSPLPTGAGSLRTRHGTVLVPSPVTVELLAAAGASVVLGSGAGEQVTPTGAAILTTVATFSRPAMRLQCVGYGAGSADLEVPNVLRVWIGDVAGLA